MIHETVVLCRLEKEIVDRVTEDMVVVLMVTDSSLYFCEDEEGARCLPERGTVPLMLFSAVK
jgi:hypothetical protein